LLRRRRPRRGAWQVPRRVGDPRLVRAAARLVAELLVDVAAHSATVPDTGEPAEPALEALRQAVRAHEYRCVAELLELFRFRKEDYEVSDLPIADGRWGLDLFSPASLRQFGIRTGRDAVVGGLAGLTVDAFTGGMTLGAAAALGATAGALWSGLRTHGRRVVDRLRGYTELRVHEATLRLLAIRQIDLVQALLRRGHASLERIRLTPEAEAVRRDWARRRLPTPLQQARANPGWSRLAGGESGATADAGRQAALDALAGTLEANLMAPPG
ncbi:MAG: DUF3482 domain-containing protein, partial [Inquilinus sp.]|nr:DUF3482 domain-containing protein [Inquilinus sp.]